MRTAPFICVVLMLVVISCALDPTSSTTGQEDIRNVWWSVTQFDPVAGEPIVLAPGEQYLLFFAADTLWGKTDSLCYNTYYAPYLLGPGDSVAIRYIVTTKVGCRASYPEYLRALEKADSFVRHGNNLTVSHSGNVKKLEFVKQ